MEPGGLRMTDVNRINLAGLLERERTSFRAEHPGSMALSRRSNHLFGGVPMTWMTRWSGGFPIALDSAKGNEITDVDGLKYIDFALGDTGADGTRGNEQDDHARWHHDHASDGGRGVGGGGACQTIRAA
jgi:hypothetical protein